MRNSARFRELGPAEVVARIRSRPDASSILASQFISEKAADAILNGRTPEFLEARAESILAYAATLSFPSSGLG